MLQPTDEKKSLKLVIKQDDKTRFTDKMAKHTKRIENNKFFSVYLNNFDKHSLQLLKQFKKKYDY